MVDATGAFVLYKKDIEEYEYLSIKVFDCDVVGNQAHRDYANYANLLSSGYEWSYAGLICVGTTEILENCCVVVGIVKDEYRRK